MPPEIPPNYAIIDLLADIGGITVLIFVCLTLFLSLWNYNYMSHYLVEKLFRIENEDIVISPGRCNSLKDFFRDVVKACICKAKAC